MHWFAAPDYWLARTAFQRGLAVVYLVAFLTAARQFRGLLGTRGLTPIPAYTARGAVRPAAEPVPAALLGPVLRRQRLERRGPGRRAGRGPGRPGPAVGGHAAVGAALGAAGVDPQRRPDLVRLRLGIHAGRDRVPGHLPGQPDHLAARAHLVPAALADLPAGVRGGHDQAARRQLLAAPDLPALPPRDPAHAGPAEL